MGLLGSLFAGVSGLNAQANEIGIISNNISNVNTVGFKQGQASFDTLVVPSGAGEFAPGGVIGQTQNLVNQQGLIQATSSSTDIAITGNGFFSVNSKADSTGNSLLTRVGSFVQDSNGDFVNADGYFLQGIPVTTPPTSVNLNNLKTVSVNQSATGTATATKAVTIGANLNANQSVLLGSAVQGTMNTTNGTSQINSGISGSQIITGNNLLTTANSNISRNDKFTITSGSNAALTFTYGGFTIGRDVTSTVNGTTTTGNGDGSAADDTLDTESLAANKIANTGGTATIQVTVNNVADYVSPNGHISISGASSINNIPASEINGEHAITSIAGNVVTFTVATTGTGVTTNNSTTAFFAANRTVPFTGNIMNATSTTSDFLTNGLTPLQTNQFTSEALKLEISVNSATPISFTYSNAPSASSGTFNSLQSLADAINDASGLTARIANNRLYVSATDANQSVSFINGDATGSGVLAGIDWVQELGLQNVSSASSGTNMFNTLNGLADQINTVDPADLLATVHNPTATASITINEANPLQTIAIADSQNPDSILKELGIANLTPGGGGDLTTGTLPVVYNATSSTSDMSSGAVTPQFSHDITIFDSQGNSHTIAMNVVKIATNEWAVEFTAVPKTDVTSTTGDGQIASGILKFDGNGVLSSDSVPSSITAGWTNGANPSTLTFNLGLGGSGDVTQSAAPFNVSVAQQDGSPIGTLTGVSIDSNGFVTETFSNGQNKQIFQVPLADVPNPNGLTSVSGDAYQESLASGQVNLNVAGQGGTGTITPSALEQSNVNLSTELTSLIVAQQAYDANSKLLTVADQLLQVVNQIIQ